MLFLNYHQEFVKYPLVTKIWKNFHRRSQVLTKSKDDIRIKSFVTKQTSKKEELKIDEKSIFITILELMEKVCSEETYEVVKSKMLDLKKLHKIWLHWWKYCTLYQKT